MCLSHHQVRHFNDFVATCFWYSNKKFPEIAKKNDLIQPAHIFYLFHDILEKYVFYEFIKQDWLNSFLCPHFHFLKSKNKNTIRRVAYFFTMGIRTHIFHFKLKAMQMRKFSFNVLLWIRAHVMHGVKFEMNEWESCKLWFCVR